MEKYPPLTSEQISLEDWQNTPINVRCLVDSLLTSASESDREILLSQFLEANQEPELKLRNLIDEIPGAVYQFRLSPEGTYSMIFMSEGVRELGGIFPEQATNDIQVIWDLILPEDLELLHQSISLSAETLEPWHFEFRIQNDSKKIKWILGKSLPSQQEDGAIIWNGILTDISDRKFVEEKFREQQTQLDLVVEASQIGFYISDFRTETSIVSPAYKTQIGYTPDAIEASPDDWSDRLHPADRERATTAFRAFKNNEASYSEDFRLLHRDGSYRWIYSNAQLICDKAGTPIKIVGTHIDITDRKKAEEDISRSVATNQALIDALPDLIIRISREGIYIDAIPSGNVKFAVPPKKMIGNSIFDVLPIEFAQQRMYYVEQAFQTGKLQLYEYQILIDGEIHYEEARIVVSGENEATILIRDISDRKKAEEDLRRAVATKQALIDALPDLIIRISRDGVYLDAISSATMKFSHPPDTFIGKCMVDILPSELAQQLMYYIEQAFQTQKIQLHEYQIFLNGEIHYEEARIVISGENEATILIRDISDRKKAELSLRESKERYRVLAENINDLVCLHHPDGQYLYVSPSCEALLGYRYDEMLGQDPYTYFHPDDRDRIRQVSHAAVLAGKATPITYRMRHKSGNYIWFETLTTPIMDATGQVIQLQTTSRDVSDRIQVQNQLEYDTLHDTLTGLPNRHLLMERLDLSLHRAKRLEDYHFAVLFLDLDRFKVINDSLGHLAGDKLLIAISRNLQATLREIDLVARLGGDEFVILLDEIKDIQEAIHATQRIFAELQTPLTIEGREVYTTSSIGIVLGTKDYAKASHLLRDADIAMYRAKARGKARYEIFDTQMHREALSRMHLENDLRQAISSQEFILHYQPIVSLDNGHVVGFEALMRWQHPSQGLKYPGEFIAIAEEIGLISMLSSWALRSACQQLAAWQTAFPNLTELKVSVNLSAKDLRRSDLFAEVDRLLAQTQLDARCLTLEITESMLIEDVESAIRVFSQMRERGIQISLDDFGTGYSSLNYLHRLPMDNLKVDRSFVNQMQEGKKNHQIIEMIATLSKQLELDAIAEGIETSHQLKRLQELGYRFGQGYLFSKPLSPEAAESLLRDTNLCLFP
ncbi:MAG: hypothetical protein DCF20_18400 [Pseudanabaena sp.]|nr:MAG: hypothetical protein DCF20_18400 [Pseudanabaena sp.]